MKTIPELVIQEEKTGCGIACVAMISNKSYKEIKQLANSIGIYTEDTALWSDTGHVRSPLKKLNINIFPNECEFISWNEVPSKALLATKWHVDDGKPFWHWSVFHRDKGKQVVLDPSAYLKNNYRTDLDSIKPK